jgi:preprotein translocase subunit SecG
MLTVLILIHLMVVIAMIGTVLLQRSEGGGLGVGQTGGFLSSRGTANVLTRTTAILATAFFATSLALSIVAGIERKPQSILQNNSEAPAEPTPGAPSTAPTTLGGRGILDLPQNQGQPAPQGQPPAQSQAPAPPRQSQTQPPSQSQPPARPSGQQAPQPK